MATLVFSGLLTADPLDAPRTTVPAVIVGGSAAKGWHDRTNEGYVARALGEYEGMARIQFVIENHAIPGATVTDRTIARHFPRWMKRTRGGLVVIAWGLLNDIRLKTNDNAVLGEVKREIRDALATHHVVLVVSPPATIATFTFDRSAQPRLWRQIAAVATSFHSPHISVIDVMQPMQADILAHHQSPWIYMKGKWDPDTRGHMLAAHFLVQGLKRVWGGSMPRFSSKR